WEGAGWGREGGGGGGGGGFGRGGGCGPDGFGPAPGPRRLHDAGAGATDEQLDLSGLNADLVAIAAVDDLEDLGDFVIAQRHADFPRSFGRGSVGGRSVSTIVSDRRAAAPRSDGTCSSARSNDMRAIGADTAKAAAGRPLALATDTATHTTPARNS